MLAQFAWPWLTEPDMKETVVSAQSKNTAAPGLLLSGPPAFILLSLVIAFAVYLRQGSNRAVELWTRIQAGEEKIYPIGRDHTNQKLTALENTHDNIDVAAPFLILLAVVVAVRIIADATLRFPSPPYPVLAKILPVSDLIIVVWISSLFAILGFVHYSARRTDKSVRASTNAFLIGPVQLPLKFAEPKKDEAVSLAH